MRITFKRAKIRIVCLLHSIQQFLKESRSKGSVSKCSTNISIELQMGIYTGLCSPARKVLGKL